MCANIFDHRKKEKIYSNGEISVTTSAISQ